MLCYFLNYPGYHIKKSDLYNVSNLDDEQAEVAADARRRA
jgi:hypothetical protein